MKKGKAKRHRSAKTGKFVKKTYAEKNRATTVTETVKGKSNGPRE